MLVDKYKGFEIHQIWSSTNNIYFVVKGDKRADSTFYSLARARETIDSDLSSAALTRAKKANEQFKALIPKKKELMVALKAAEKAYDAADGALTKAATKLEDLEATMFELDEKSKPWKPKWVPFFKEST